jgi:hypothetical protein
MRIAASWCHPLQVNSLPLGDFIAVLGLINLISFKITCDILYSQTSSQNDILILSYFQDQSEFRMFEIQDSLILKVIFEEKFSRLKTM